MHETKREKGKRNKRKKNESNHWREKKRRLLPVSLFTGAPHKYATSLNGKQREKDPLFKREIVLPANI